MLKELEKSKSRTLTLSRDLGVLEAGTKRRQTLCVGSRKPFVSTEDEDVLMGNQRETYTVTDMTT